MNIARGDRDDTGAEKWVEAGVPRDRIVVVRPGVDLSWFIPGSDPPMGFTLSRQRPDPARSPHAASPF